MVVFVRYPRATHHRREGPREGVYHLHVGLQQEVQSEGAGNRHPVPAKNPRLCRVCGGEHFSRPAALSSGNLTIIPSLLCTNNQTFKIGGVQTQSTWAAIQPGFPSYPQRTNVDVKYSDIMLKYTPCMCVTRIFMRLSCSETLGEGFRSLK